MELIKKVERKYLRKDLPDFKPGDTVRVWVKIQEGDKERLQAFEGICIRKRKGGAGASFTVRKISYGSAWNEFSLSIHPLLTKLRLSATVK